MDKSKKHVLIFFAIILIFIFSACQSDVKISEDAPKILRYTFEPYNNGNESTQYVKANIIYDKAISVNKDSARDFRITIGGDRVKTSNISTYVDNKNDHILIINMHVTGITDGKILISSIENNDRVKGINDKSKKSPAAFKTINALIPSGVELKTLSSVTGDNKNSAKVTKELTSIWKVRGIAWIKLVENGRSVLPQTNNSKVKTENNNADSGTNNKLELKVFNRAVSVHGHGINDMNKYYAVNDIADVLKECFEDRYNISVNDTTFTVESKIPANGQTIDVEIMNNLTE